MLASENPKPEAIAFQKLMIETNNILNQQARLKHDYFSKRVGILLEDDVADALCYCSKGTPFEGTIIKVSGQKFPDIIANKLYGVEVKSTKGNHWTSTGSSILETTRVQDIKRIYMTFGKLGGNPIEFISKPYEDCLCDIAVTHMPRYLINMKLHPGETIFDKMHISYDELREKDNPIAPVAEYYRSLLKPGESLWWAGDTPEEKVVPMKLTLWKGLPLDVKTNLKSKALAFIPELFGNGSNKYNKLIFWLISEYGVVSPSTRDMFSAGGQIKVLVNRQEYTNVPRIIGHIVDNAKIINEVLDTTEPGILKAHWGFYDDLLSPRNNWIKLATHYSQNRILDKLLKEILEHYIGAMVINNALEFPKGITQIKETMDYSNYGR